MVCGPPPPPPPPQQQQPPPQQPQPQRLPGSVAARPLPALMPGRLLSSHLAWLAQVYEGERAQTRNNNLLGESLWDGFKGGGGEGPPPLPPLRRLHLL